MYVQNIQYKITIYFVLQQIQYIWAEVYIVSSIYRDAQNMIDMNVQNQAVLYGASG